MSQVTGGQSGLFHQPAPPADPVGRLRVRGQHSLQGAFHASLIIILEFVLIANQGKGVRDSELRRQGKRHG